MRWQPLSFRDPHPLNGLWIWPLVVVTAPIWGSFVLLIKLDEWKGKLMGPSRDRWRPWFAWHPVLAEYDGFHVESVWLEWVERRSQEYGHGTQHRVLPDNQ